MVKNPIIHEGKNPTKAPIVSIPEYIEFKPKIYSDKCLEKFFQEIKASSEENCWKDCVTNKTCIASVYTSSKCFLFDKTFKISKKNDKVSCKVYSKINLEKTQQYLMSNFHMRLENTRLTGHYQLLMYVSLEECWNKCVSDSRCNSITFLHGNRKPHYQLDCCFLIASAKPCRSRDDEKYFTSFVRVYPR
jgi:hypothetical protein